MKYRDDNSPLLNLNYGGAMVFSFGMGTFVHIWKKVSLFWEFEYMTTRKEIGNTSFETIKVGVAFR